MVMRCRLSARGLTDRTSPTSLIMPVNMLHPLEYFERISAKLLAPARVQLPGEAVERHSLQRLDAARADILLALQHHHFVRQAGGSDGAGNLWTALHHQPGDALLGQHFQHFVEIE